MGNCGGLCTNNLSKFKGDIIMEKLIEDNDNNSVVSYNLYKIKYLQKEIKHFLKRKKIHKSNHSSNKSTKQNGIQQKQSSEKNNENNLVIHHHYNSHSKKSSSKSQAFKNSSLYKTSNHTKSNKYLLKIYL